MADDPTRDAPTFGQLDEFFARTLDDRKMSRAEKRALAEVFEGVDDRRIVPRFVNEFERLWNQFEPL